LRPARPLSAAFILVFAGCAQIQKIVGDAPPLQRPTDLTVALLPINTTGDPGDAELHTRIASKMNSLQLFKSVNPANWGSPANSDLILSIHQCYVNGGPRCDDDRPIVAVSSGKTGKLLYTARPRAASNARFGIDPERIAFEAAEAFAPEGPLHALVSAQQKPNAAVPLSSEMKIIPTGSGQAETEGDAAAGRGQTAVAFTSYVRALDGMPSNEGTELREKLLKLAAKERTLPDVPQEARRHAVRAETFVKIAQAGADYRLAVSEYQQAVSIAPWWADAYRDLGYAQERVGEHKAAMRNLKLYLAGAPNASDAQTVQDRIYALEVLIERGK